MNCAISGMRPCGVVSRRTMVVRAEAAAAGVTAPFKVPQKGSLPKDAEGIKAMINKSHEMHGQGRSMWFCLSGAGKRGSVGTSITHADQLDWSAVSQSASSMDSYNIFT